MSTTTKTPTGEALTPQPIHETLMAYCGSKLLMSAVEIDLFTTLAQEPATEEQLRQRLNLHPRFATHFLTALVTLGFLRRDGDLYRNSPLAGQFLDRNRPTSIVGFAEMTSDTFYPAWGRLTKALRTGQAQAPVPPDDNEHLFRVNSIKEPDRVRRFLTAMDSHSTRMGEELANRIDWSSYQTFADLGGARGNLAAVIAKAHPHLKGTCFDRPQSRPFFDEHIAALGLADRVAFESGDFFADELPEVDVLIFGHVLHDWGPEARRGLLTRAYQRLRPDGALVIYDRMIDGSPQDLNRLFYSLTFMLGSAGGSEYSIEECTGWLREAGFERTTSASVLNDHTIVIAHR